MMLALSLTATHLVMGQDHSPEPAAISNQTENALNILSDSTHFIESAVAFSARGQAGGELLMKNGQLVEHGTSFNVLFDRPLKLRLKLNSRDGTEATMIFDGERITAASYVEGKHIYDTTTQQGDVNESLDFLTSYSGSSRELANFLTEQMTKSLDGVQSGISLGASTVDGVLCDHLALRTETRDIQVWVERGDEPKPRRILITYRERPSNPRFWIQFNEWDFSPEFSDHAFRYIPPEGARKVHYFQE